MRFIRIGVNFIFLQLMFAGAILLMAISANADPVAIPQPSAAAVEYHTISNFVWGGKQIISMLVPIAFLILGSGSRFSSKLSKFGKFRTVIVLSATLFVVGWVIQLPLERIRSRQLSVTKEELIEPFIQWAFGQLISSLPMIVVSVLTSLLVYWLIVRSPRRWWLSATVIFSILSLIVLIAEPLTLSHIPLGQTEIENKIAEIAGRSGIDRASIAFEECEPFNSCEIARVPGLGPTRLILLNKGLLEEYPESWILQTVAHESKHFAIDDNLTGWIVLTLIFLFFSVVIDRLSRFVVRRFSVQLRISSISQPSALPLLILLLNAIFLASLPPINLFRQHVEFAADRYALEQTHENHAFAEMAASWTTTSKTHVPNPSPFFMLFRSSHPSDAERINFANEFRPDDDTVPR